MCYSAPVIHVLAETSTCSAPFCSYSSAVLPLEIVLALPASPCLCARKHQKVEPAAYEPVSFHRDPLNSTNFHGKRVRKYSLPLCSTTICRRWSRSVRTASCRARTGASRSSSAGTSSSTKPTDSFPRIDSPSSARSPSSPTPSTSPDSPVSRSSRYCLQPPTSYNSVV